MTKNYAIDWRLCLELANHNEEIADELLAMFVNELTTTQAELEHYFQQANWQKLQDCVHKLHGGACYTGVPFLRAAAKQLESALRNNNSDVTNEFHDLLTQMQAVSDAFTQGTFSHE